MSLFDRIPTLRYQQRVWVVLSLLVFEIQNNKINIVKMFHSCRSPVPQKSISKLSVLSSSLCQLTPESEKQPKPTTDDQSTHESENDIKEDVNLFDDGQYDTLAPPPTPPSTKDNDIMMRTRTSSFHDDLMSHFERRLSDLGPRSKYPYLQQLDRNREKGLSAKGGDALGAGHSEEVLSKKRTGGRDKKWLKYTFSAK